MKFQVGDEVKITGKYSGWTGKRGKIDKIYLDEPYMYRVLGGAFKEDELELVQSRVQFSVGDIVFVLPSSEDTELYIKKDVGRVVGLMGQIKKMPETESTTDWPLIEFEGLKNGHGDKNNQWYVDFRNLKLISSAKKSNNDLLPADAKERKRIPLASGLLDYFTSALIEVAKVSQVGNDQHNPGQPLHWARGKSTDQADTMIRHFLERGTFDSDGVRHSAKMCWRALAILQLELEAEGAPLARGAKE